MAQGVLRIEGLPDAPLDAALAFHAEHLAGARELARDGSLTLVFAPASHEHRAWRLAVVQELARESAPHRVNGVTGAGDRAIEDALAYLANAAGVTGQLLAVDGKAGEKG